MIDFVESYNIAGFKGRAVHNLDSDVTFRLKRAAHVRLTGEEWRDLLRSLRTRTANTRRAMRLACLLQIPFAIAILMLLGALNLLKPLSEAIDSAPTVAGYPVLSVCSIILETCAMPAWFVVIHIRNVRRVQRSLERELAKRPRCAAPTAGRAEINALERIGFLVLAPHVIISTYGTVYPDAFRNTPLTGQQITLWDVVAVAVITVLAILRRRSLGVLTLKKRGDRADLIVHGSRRSDPIARARVTNEAA